MAARADTPGSRLMQLPLFLLLIGAASVAMLVPAVYAGVIRELPTARAFLYSGLLGLIAFGLIALTLSNRPMRRDTLGPLVALFSAFTVLPAMLAIPFYEALGTTTFYNAYVEMVSAMTTTGAPVFDDPRRLNDALHLWRALVGWLGGLLMWVSAAAILAPLNLGGFEVTARAEPGRRQSFDVTMALPDARFRLARAARLLVPAYAGLTLLVWILLLVSGDVSLVALSHAMSIMATSGISPVGGVQNGQSSIPGEAVMLLFMLFALSRLTFSTDTMTSDSGGLRSDPEFRIGVGIALVVPMLLFLRHWYGAFDVGQEDSWAEAVQALWGGLFTTLSFLTTTGFQSIAWGAAQSWSGLQTPGLLLMGLALIGGGVATTAGGVKLLRVYALYKHGLRETEQLVHPSSVSGAGGLGRRLQRQGAFIAWIFFMLFALSIAVVTLALTALGVDFETAIVLTIAGLSTTGPLIEVAASEPIRLIELSAGAKAVFTAAMVIGRLETLAIVALLTPDLWRR